MASIEINNLAPVGSHFFQDSETYLDNLSEEELGIKGGGITPLTTKFSLTLCFSSPWTYPKISLR